MTNEQFLKNLEVPEKAIDVVLDTDAYNEVDDQYAIAYMLRSEDKIKTKAIYAAPFYNNISSGPEDGMNKSYNEILNLLKILDKDVPVFKGSCSYLENEATFVESPAARDLVARAMNYSIECPIYVIAIGAITNVASALIMRPEIAEKIVVVWLSGHAHHYNHTREFNMYQDYAAARVVMQSNAPFVQIPCMGVASQFLISKSEIKELFVGKSIISDYLANITFKAMEYMDDEEIWSRVIWDVTAIAWLLNDDERFMQSRIINCRLPGYDNMYEQKPQDKLINYVYFIKRDALLRDLVKKLV